jgi:hypothetical protein
MDVMPSCLIVKHIIESYFVLQVEFEWLGDRCKPASALPPTAMYHQDELTCASQHSVASLALTVILALPSAVVRWPH